MEVFRRAIALYKTVKQEEVQQGHMILRSRDGAERDRELLMHASKPTPPQIDLAQDWLDRNRFGSNSQPVTTELNSYRIVDTEAGCRRQALPNEPNQPSLMITRLH